MTGPARQPQRASETPTWLAPPRVVIDAVFPEVDGGRFPAKRSAHEAVEVRAHIFTDGHDHISAVVCYRRAGDADWLEAPLTERQNDEWTATIPAGDPGMVEFTVEAWIDEFGSWRADLEQRIAAGWDIGGELQEGGQIAGRAAGRADWPDREYLEWVGQQLREADEDIEARRAIALDERLREMALRHADRSAASRYQVLELLVDAERARFGAWYELFPRSAGDASTVSGTLTDVIARLPDIADMGFDVLYLPPIHPIGHTGRKGPNNSLHAGPGDPGSPWAIGSEAGGHTAVHPDLGSIEDVDALVRAARLHGIEVALDFALQCSPDHPWVREHPSWFKQRPDGSIRHAENPPKRYEDIYPLDLAGPDWEAQWQAILQVLEFWIAHGVRTFRVDNPHTKPYPFWAWLIGELRARHPDLVFLAEAFTRPKRMYALAKRGFNQSYSYFTWRNTKSEIVEYFTELSQPPVSDFYRPNLFVNTPDILHETLQHGGRAAFMVRAILAATLGPSWGIYSGFELLDGEGIEGTEEYRDSEKYQVRRRDWDAPGNIKPLIRTLNRLRREHTSLQFMHDLWFLPVENEAILAFTKAAPGGRERMLVVVNLDLHEAQDGWVGLPLEQFGLASAEPFRVRDLLSGDEFEWEGEWNRVRLEPEVTPARMFVLRTPEQTAGQASGASR